MLKKTYKSVSVDECIKAFHNAKDKESEWDYSWDRSQKLSFDEVCKKYNKLIDEYWTSQNLHIGSEIKEIKRLLKNLERALNNENIFNAKIYLDRIINGGYEIREDRGE
ncbi:hypothetical protein [Campylobacter ureolyticus]|uniref:Uncharacterized protein n=1 Tax=Campylobacter ureolyticus TaxID=827 RepID=A0A9Q4KPX1_9BACT|nr:hypothetical protein [Campylobacter ureolyticus]MCZ6161972.1 hypothetical protein [Campylobacter ureolyticus]MCZ6170952.1 hypothetical protein [Campylobacter ureolyticus]